MCVCTLGNVRVCVRVRPMIGDEEQRAEAESEHNQVGFPDEVSVEISRASQQVFKTEARKNLFTYDRCFAGDATQEQVRARAI